MQILIETKSEILTRKIVRQLFAYIKQYSGDDLETSFTVDDINIKLTIVYESDASKLRIFAETTNIIDITILTNRQSFNSNDFQLIYHKLTNIIRHELTHQQQLRKQQSLTPDYEHDEIFTNIDALKSYLLNTQEVEAFVNEIYFAAKRQKNTFNEVFKERIKPFIQMMLNAKQNPTLIKQTFSLVKQRWFEYAKERFPNVRLT